MKIWKMCESFSRNLETIWFSKGIWSIKIIVINHSFVSDLLKTLERTEFIPFQFISFYSNSWPEAVTKWFPKNICTKSKVPAYCYSIAFKKMNFLHSKMQNKWNVRRLSKECVHCKWHCIWNEDILMQWEANRLFYISPAIVVKSSQNTWLNIKIRCVKIVFILVVLRWPQAPLCLFCLALLKKGLRNKSIHIFRTCRNFHFECRFTCTFSRHSHLRKHSATGSVKIYMKYVHCNAVSI